MPATVFVTSGYMGGDREFWWDELEALLLEPGSLPAKLELPIQGRVHRWELEGAVDYSEEDWERFRHWIASETAPTVRHALYLTLWRLLQLCAEPERQVALRALQAGLAGRNMSARLTGNFRLRELVSLHDGGLVEIGAHTVTHPFWTTFRPRSARRAAYIEEALEAMLGVPVGSFAFPYGAHSTALVSVVRDAGYTCACTTEQLPCRAASILFVCRVWKCGTGTGRSSAVA